MIRGIVYGLFTALAIATFCCGGSGTDTAQGPAEIDGGGGAGAAIDVAAIPTGIDGGGGLGAAIDATASSGGQTGMSTAKAFVPKAIMTDKSPDCVSRYCPSSWSDSCTGTCGGMDIDNSYWPACGKAYCKTDAECIAGMICIFGIQQYPWNTGNCLPPRCNECDGTCNWDSAACKFLYCTDHNGVITSSGGNSGGGGSNGSGGKTGTTVPNPPVNCSEYSFPGCSVSMANGFGDTCIRAGCHFDLGSCVSHGGTSDSTCDCRCY